MTLSIEKLKWLLSDEIGGINSWFCSDHIKDTARALIKEVLKLSEENEAYVTKYLRLIDKYTQVCDRVAELIDQNVELREQNQKLLKDYSDHTDTLDRAWRAEAVVNAARDALNTLCEMGVVENFAQRLDDALDDYDKSTKGDQ